MQVNPYLNFLGNTEDAFEYYAKAFKSEISQKIRFNETLSPEELEKMSVEDQNKIMHISLPVGNCVFMGTDVIESAGQKLTIGDNFSLSITADSKEEADNLFDALSKDGKVEVKMQDMFWGDYWGMCNDKFGIKWMVSVPNQNNS